MVCAEAMHRQGTLQDYYARGLQRATLLPPAHGRVYGVRMAAGQSRRPAGPRRENAGVVDVSVVVNKLYLFYVRGER